MGFFSLFFIEPGNDSPIYTKKIKMCSIKIGIGDLRTKTRSSMKGQNADSRSFDQHSTQFTKHDIKLFSPLKTI